MKKVLAIFAIAALVACGGATSTEVVTDSSAVVVDSTKVDSVAVTVDSVKAEEAPKVEEVK